MQWLDDFKVALIEEQHERLSLLCQNLPSFENKKQMQEAKSLIDEAIITLSKERQTCKSDMEKIKKSSAFLFTKEKKPRINTLS